jgi:gliding motility-associated-like protein
VKNLLCILFILPLFVAGQSAADWWYFGVNAGLHFTPTGPVAVLDGQLNSTQGCSSISDEFGNLLFYSKGDEIWDASHNPMLNSAGLIGNSGGNPAAGDASQNSYIVPRPDHPSEYYHFQIKRLGGGGLFYSKIDMTLNGGLGGVVLAEKNVPLIDSTTEMITCLRKPNSIDFWVVALRKPGDTAYAFEITSAGINTTPVLSNTGLPLIQQDQLGYLKGSQQNDKIAMTMYWAMIEQTNPFQVHLFDFDNATGQMTYDYGITPSLQDTFNYGVEFSPNGNFLYVQSWILSDLRQYDLSSGDPALVSASEQMVGIGYTGTGGGALQLGPDGKIYVARGAAPLLACVNFPNDPGPLCGYDHDAVNLAGPTSTRGLPQFFPFFIEGDVAVLDRCLGDTSFFFSNYLSSDSVFWNFGDPAPGVNDTSTQINPFHIYQNPGTYTVTHIAYSAFLTDTTIVEVNIFPPQSISFPDDTILCDGQVLTFDLDQPGAISYLWQDGSTDSAFIATDSGLVKVTLFGICDTVTDSVQVLRLAPLDLDLGLDTIVCGDSSIVIGDTIPTGYDILWSNGASQPFIEIDSNANYLIEVTSACGALEDSINVRFFPNLPDSLLPRDTINCFDANFTLVRPTIAGVSFVWSDSSNQRTFEVGESQVVWLAAFNACGTFVDTMNILFNGELTTSFGPDTVICDEDTVLLKGSDSLATYLWSTGDTVDSIWTKLDQRMQRYSVTITKGQCSKVESIRFDLDDNACPSIDCDVEYSNIFTPNGDGINDLFRPSTTCNIFSYQLTIFNRWGQLVHETRNIAYGWDGCINGEMAAEGVYYFTLDYKDEVAVDVDRNVFAGSFTLKR